MREIFRILEVQQGEKGEPGVCIAINLRVGGRDAPCAISGFCRTEGELEAEAKSIRTNLDQALEKGKAILGKDISKEEAMKFTDDMSAEDIWSLLAKVKDERVFVQKFNSLDEKRRREVAEHVLAECNVFTGKGAVFSARYNNETTYME